MLDLHAVRLFILAADLGSLTRAAEAAGTTQPVVSQRLKVLEDVLGRRLLDRTPRYVRTTQAGAAFLPRARALLAAHDAALAPGTEPDPRVSIGASDHAVGESMGRILARLRAALPAASIEMRLDLSQRVREAYEAGEIDAAVLRREGRSGEGEWLGDDPLGWRAPEGWALPDDGILPLALLRPPCGVRAVAIEALDNAGVAWRPAFVAGSCSALVSAVRAGFGVAPLGRVASGGLPDLGPALGLPPLPPSRIVLVARAPDAPVARAVRVLAEAIRRELA